MFWLQLRTIVDNASKNCSWLQLGLQHGHSYSVWTPKMDLLLVYIYKIICSIFHINQLIMISFEHNKKFNVRILILINSRWHQKFWRRYSNHDQIYVALKILTSGLAALILELIDFGAWNQNIWHQDWDRATLKKLTWGL
jgi:hypothetical protein